MGRARSVGIFGLALVTGGLVGGGLALALAPPAGRGVLWRAQEEVETAAPVA